MRGFQARSSLMRPCGRPKRRLTCREDRAIQEELPDEEHLSGVCHRELVGEGHPRLVAQT